MKNTLLLVDGNALVYRAYHAFPKDLTSPDGKPSGATFGFTRILMAAIKTLKPTHVAVCFDTKRKTFRDDLLEQYKAQRPPMPDDLREQIPVIWELVDRLEAPRFCLDGFEADDLIGTIARKIEATETDFNVIIMTGDQDLIQLVSEKISVYMPQIGFAKATMYTPDKVKEKYGFSPIQMIDYKGLRGDTSDNIPGVPGIGEVTGKDLIQRFGTIEALYTAVHSDATDGIKPAVLKKLKENEEMARLSYKVATIKVDVPLEFEVEACRLEIKYPEKLVEFFQKLNFKSLMNELPTGHRIATTAADVFAQADNEPEAEHDDTSSKSAQLDRELEPILRDMEHTGVMVDKPYLALLESQFATNLSEISESIYELAGQPFNLDSPTQIAVILYEKLSLPTEFVRKGKTGYTTDADTLTRLAKDYPICALILKYRELAKLLSTYVKPLQELTDEHSRIHTSYAPDTATGRISSRNPNLQNIPVKTENGRLIRQAFIAPKGRVLVAADYSQIELRVAAHLSKDPVMTEAFSNDRDFHAETAARMNVDRRVAKIINFSILYGKGAFGFSQDLGITVAEAKTYIEQYFKTYSGLKKYIDTLLEKARIDGYVTTMMGRRRYLPDLKGSNFNHRSAAEREAVNLPIQGAAAEVLKLAMVKLARALKDRTDVKLILTVHDELVLEVDEASKEEVAKLVRTTMEHAFAMTVPLKVDVECGANWAQLEAILD